MVWHWCCFTPVTTGQLQNCVFARPQCRTRWTLWPLPALSSELSPPFCLCLSSSPPLIPRVAGCPKPRGLSGDQTPLQVLISCLGLDGRWVLEHFFLRAVGRGVQPLHFETGGACRASLPDFADWWGRTLKKCKVVCNCGGGIPNESRTSGHRNCKAERCWRNTPS